MAVLYQILSESELRFKSMSRRDWLECKIDAHCTYAVIAVMKNPAVWLDLGGARTKWL